MRGYGQQELGWKIQQLAAHWAENGKVRATRSLTSGVGPFSGQWP